MRYLFLSFLFMFKVHAWSLYNVDSRKPFYCPQGYIPIISEYKKHFVIPLGGEKGGEIIFSQISTDFVVKGQHSVDQKYYHMHCAKYVKSDCHHCDTSKPDHENYCVHYLHPTKGKQKGCLTKGVIPLF